MRLILSGGGTGGHIIPNIALIHDLREKFTADELLYIGSKNGMESQMIPEISVKFAGITCGKLRRYFSWDNFVDFFRIPIGIFQSCKIIAEFKPDVIFCKGGYVCLPVAIAGWLMRVPVVLHESDVMPGLTNRLSTFFAKKVCVAFEESGKYFPAEKVVVTGNPIRSELAQADPENGRKFLDFNDTKPILLVMGGSSGAAFINELIWRNLDRLLPHYQIVHICGEGKVKPQEEILKMVRKEHQDFLENYRAFSFVNHELKHLYAVSSLILSRSGAIALAEIHFFQKPALLIPLSKIGSRGDQIINAEIYAKNNRAIVLEQGIITDEKLFEAIKLLLSSSKQDSIQHRHTKALEANSKIIDLLRSI